MPRIIGEISGGITHGRLLPPYSSNDQGAGTSKAMADVLLDLEKSQSSVRTLCNLLVRGERGLKEGRKI